MIAIRFARSGERQQLEDLQRRASLALGGYNAQLEANPDAIHLPPEQIALGQLFVAERDGDTVGFAALVMSEHSAELDGLFVEPGLWGRGIGKALVEHAVHQARRKGLALSVVASPASRPFYERCGFTVEGEATTRFGPALSMSR